MTDQKPEYTSAEGFAIRQVEQKADRKQDVDEIKASIVANYGKDATASDIEALNDAITAVSEYYEKYVEYVERKAQTTFELNRNSLKWRGDKIQALMKDLEAFTANEIEEIGYLDAGPSDIRKIMHGRDARPDEG
jgi:hypothetical protein